MSGMRHFLTSGVQGLNSGLTCLSPYYKLQIQMCIQPRVFFGRRVDIPNIQNILIKNGMKLALRNYAVIIQI
jgi:hypothetical protein